MTLYSVLGTTLEIHTYLPGIYCKSTSFLVQLLCHHHLLQPL